MVCLKPLIKKSQQEYRICVQILSGSTTHTHKNNIEIDWQNVKAKMKLFCLVLFNWKIACMNKLIINYRHSYQFNATLHTQTPIQIKIEIT